MHHNGIIELATGKLRNGTDEATFRVASNQAQASLQHYSGFVSRAMFRDREQERWIDLVQWEDQKSAMRAAETFMHDAAAASLIACLDQSTLTMRHFEKHNQLGIEHESCSDPSTAKCVELLMYRLKEGTHREQYEQVMGDIAQTIQTFPAFIRREVGCDAAAAPYYVNLKYESHQR